MPSKYPICDYECKCKNKAYREVYPSLMSKKHKGCGWSYLCKKHFYQEEKRLKNKLPWSTVAHGTKKRRSCDFIRNVQQVKMKELWGNKKDKVWEKS